MERRSSLLVRGEALRPLPTAFIIDSPWLPNWAGHTILDYFTDERIFLDDNLKAIRTFPEAIFLPGFWSEYGMCTEPSAFGSVSIWGENEFPFAKKVLHSPSEVEHLEKPDPRKHGLLPFVIKRLKHLQPEIEKAGHKIRFAVARGPLNIASFLMGTSEFLEASEDGAGADASPARYRHGFLGGLDRVSARSIPVNRRHFFARRYCWIHEPSRFRDIRLCRICSAHSVRTLTVKFFHNDAPCKASAPLLADAGINLLNFGIQHTLAEMKTWTNNRIALMGNIPPRDVLAEGTPADVKRSVREMLNALDDRSRLIVSCGGGMPPHAPTENIKALISTVEELTR